MTDQQLLREFAKDHSDTAFAELVRRYVDLVYSAAFRMVGEAHAAEDVTQAAFVELAQNAERLANHPVLSGWLHCATRNITAKSIRSEARRRAREQEAATMNQLISDEPEGSWKEIAPHLDAALGELGEADRDALLLRFFEKKSAQEMAAVLGVSAEAAQKRVSRAVERLRKIFSKRNVTVGASGLVVLVSANAVQSAPAGLALTISAAATLSATLTSTAIITTKAIAMTTFQKTVMTVTIAALAGVGIYEARQAALLREQNLSLQQWQATQTAQIQELENERETASIRLASLRQENDQLARNLARQRDASITRSQNKPASGDATAKSSTPQAQPATEQPTIPLLPAEDWKNVGTATPNDALQTLFWAASNQDTNTFIKTLIWDEAAKAKLDSLFAAAPEDIRSQFGSVDGLIFEMAMGGHDTPMTGFGIVSVNIQGDDATVTEEHQYQDGKVRQNPITLHREDDGWHIVLDEKRLEKLGTYLSYLASQNPNR